QSLSRLARQRLYAQVRTEIQSPHKQVGRITDHVRHVEVAAAVTVDVRPDQDTGGAGRTLVDRHGAPPAQPTAGPVQDSDGPPGVGDDPLRLAVSVEVDRQRVKQKIRSHEKGNPASLGPPRKCVSPWPEGLAGRYGYGANRVLIRPAQHHVEPTIPVQVGES